MKQVSKKLSTTKHFDIEKKMTAEKKFEKEC